MGGRPRPHVSRGVPGLETSLHCETLRRSALLTCVAELGSLFATQHTAESHVLMRASACGGRYQRYADQKGWKVQRVTESVMEGGGYKECVLQVRSLNTAMCAHVWSSPASFVLQMVHAPTQVLYPQPEGAESKHDAMSCE